MTTPSDDIGLPIGVWFVITAQLLGIAIGRRHSRAACSLTTRDAGHNQPLTGFPNE